MFDPYVRPLIDPPLNVFGRQLAAWGVSATTVTILGFAFGLAAIFLIAFGYYGFALFCLCTNRLLDGLDGAVARHTRLTDFGGFLDIVCDFIIYSGIVFAFGIARPEMFFYAAFLIFSFVGPITSFLAYAILAAKKQKTCARRGKKSFYYLGGLCEGTETAVALIFMCIFPNAFPEICLVYGALCWITTIGRVYSAWCDFGANSSSCEPSFESVGKEQEAATERPTP